MVYFKVVHFMLYDSQYRQKKEKEPTVGSRQPAGERQEKRVLPCPYLKARTPRPREGLAVTWSLSDRAGHVPESV